MPRFYFHLLSPSTTSRDEIGTDFAGIETAYLDAYQAALEISVEMLRGRRDPADHWFEIRNEKDDLLFDLPFSEVLHPAARAQPGKDIHASLHAYHKRAQQIRFELRTEFEHAKSLIQSTRELLASSHV